MQEFLRGARKVFLNATRRVVRRDRSSRLSKSEEDQRDVNCAFGFTPFVRLLCTSVVAMAAWPIATAIWSSASTTSPIA